AHALTSPSQRQQRHLAPRDVDERKAPSAAARDKKIISPRAQEEEVQRLDTGLAPVSEEERLTCLCLSGLLLLLRLKPVTVQPE
ncbi:hypothetical protein E3U43_019251, partial [Larimichthys crocea]